MATASELYPASPELEGEGVETSTSYRIRAVVVLVALLLFLALYLGLIAGTAWVIYWVFTTPAKLGYWGFMLAVGAAMLLAFFVKGLFKRSRVDKDRHLQVTEADQPELFAFVRRLCDDAGAKFPGAIYLTHEVNAAVFYPRSLLSLFLPRRKSLLIGLGLVNLLNVSELKAVLAHEFGHFAQSSMKLGQYVYVANQAIFDMAFARDSWDRLLAQWRRIDLRVSFPAWALTGIIWLVRKGLELAFKLVNRANASLSREMEFNADLAAARLTGSDALVAGLWKAERGGLAMQLTWSNLRSLAEHQRYSDDLFFHQHAELERLDGLLDKAEEQSPYIVSLRQAYRYGPEAHFQVGDDHAPSMWASHPSNRDRELNVKRHYVALEPVETSAWQLFKHRKKLKRKLTLKGYARALDLAPTDLTPAAEVQELVEEDREEREQAPHYHGLYENRVVDPGKLERLMKKIDDDPELDLDKLRRRARRWTGERLAAFMKRYDKSEGEEREELVAELKKADRTIFKYFYALSAKEEAARRELVGRYRFMQDTQPLILRLNAQQNLFGSVIQVLQNRQELDQQTFRDVQSRLAHVTLSLGEVARSCEKIALPKLSHMQENQDVRSFVLPEPVADYPVGNRIEGDLIGEIGRQLGQAQGRLQKLHFKNLGALLRLQEGLDPELYAPASEPAESRGGALEDGAGAALP